MASPSYAFGRALTLGVEEELLLVDAHTFALASGVSRILPERTERLKTELFECVVETTTPVCDSAEEALHELVGLRREVVARCERHGMRIHAAGLHPFSRGADQEIVPEPRYLKMKREIGSEIYRQVVAGLHVHVGMPDAESCLRAQEGVLVWLPEVLSLSANSPYRDGEETGLRSRRVGRLAELPRAGAPPVFASWADWEAFMHGRDYTRMWWDLRPHPRLGTLEVRIADQPTDVRRSAELAAVVQALAAEALDSRPETVDRERYEERRQEGAVRALPLDGLRAAIEPAARRLGTADLVRDLLDAPGEAELQLAVGRARGVHAVAADVADRSLESL